MAAGGHKIFLCPPAMPEKFAGYLFTFRAEFADYRGDVRQIRDDAILTAPAFPNPNRGIGRNTEGAEFLPAICPTI